MKKIFSMNRFEGWNLSLPLIQGGMGVGISLSSLAGAVAKAGGVGIISTAQIGFREPDFKENPLKANLRAIGSELKKAREDLRNRILWEMKKRAICAVSESISCVQKNWHLEKE